MAVAELHKSPTLNSYNETIQKSTTRTSSIRKMWQDLESEGKCETIESEETLTNNTNEIENEYPLNQNQISVKNGQVDNNKLCLQLHRSPSLDFPAKERVRKVFRDWGSKSFEGRTITLYGSRMNNCSRVQCVNEPAKEIGAKRSICRIYGRQAVLDLLAKFVRERENEVAGLLKNQFVSNFGHRPRIQSLLKGRFLRNQKFVEDKKQMSIDASELGLLRQTHAVSDIRKGFLSRLNNRHHLPNVPHSDSNNDKKYDNIEQPEEILHEMPHEISEEFETNNTQEISFLPERHDNILPYDNSVEISQLEEQWHESDTEDDNSEWHHLTRTDSDEGINVISPTRNDSQESHEDWYPYDNNVQDETPQSWFGGNYSRRSNAFNWSDDDNNENNFELTQLTNRRTVSNLLQSDFGPRLDQILMQSYLNKQNQTFDSENEVVDVITQKQDESEIINGLRVDMDTLQERINEMQTMLEACMDMQLELQKSVHQELYSALNHSSCYLCCNNGFESLPDRFGAHMYICSKCAQQINWSKVKESVSYP